MLTDEHQYPPSKIVSTAKPATYDVACMFVLVTCKTKIRNIIITSYEAITKHAFVERVPTTGCVLVYIYKND